MTTPVHRPTSFSRRLAAFALGGVVAALAAGPATAQMVSLTVKLNEPWQRVSESNKSWKPIFTAYADLTPPPKPFGSGFNQTTIWPGMEGWTEVAAWAEANSVMGKALLANQSKVVFGLPYGEDEVDPAMRERGLCVRVGIDGDIRRIEWPYLDAIGTISAYATAEMYRLGEAGKFGEAMDLGLANLRVLRQVADQTMLAEKSYAFATMADFASIQRDFLATYLDTLPVDLLRRMANDEYPYLKPADNERLKRLEMPEGDRIVAEALLKQCFDGAGQPSGDQFAETFAGLQSKDAPLTRFGAAKRWAGIAELHGSLDASLGKLNNIYDDWWRRWRTRPYDTMMTMPTELSRANKIRYAAVVLAVKDIAGLFDLRRRLIAEIDGLVTCTGLCGYRRSFGEYPDDIEKAYTTYFPKRFDFDPYDKQYRNFIYRRLAEKVAIDTVMGRLWAEGALLYGRNDNHEDDRAKNHAEGGPSGDFVLWPPIRHAARAQGLIQ
jgi:hypothetical protein